MLTSQIRPVLLLLALLDNIPWSVSENTLLTVQLPPDVVSDGLRIFQNWIINNVTFENLQLPSLVRLKNGHKLKFDNWTIVSSQWTTVSMASTKDGLAIRMSGLRIRAVTGWSFRNVQGPGTVRRGTAEVNLTDAILKIGPIRHLPILEGDGEIVRCNQNCLRVAFEDLCTLEALTRTFNTSSPLPSYMTSGELDFEQTLIDRTVHHVTAAICDHFYSSARRLMLEKLQEDFEGTALEVSERLQVDFGFSEQPVIQDQLLTLYYNSELYRSGQNGTKTMCGDQDYFVEAVPFDFGNSTREEGRVVKYAVHVMLLDAIAECLWTRHAGRKLMINDSTLPEGERGLLRVDGPSWDRPCIGDMIPDLKLRYPEPGAQVALVVDVRAAPALDVDGGRLRMKVEAMVHFHVALVNRTELVVSARAEASYGLGLHMDTDGVLQVVRVLGQPPVVRSIKEPRISVTLEELASVLEALQMTVGEGYVLTRLNHIRLPLPMGPGWTFSNGTVGFEEDHAIVRVPATVTV